MKSRVLREMKIPGDSGKTVEKWAGWGEIVQLRARNSRRVEGR